jgi:hypothetical protein
MLLISHQWIFSLSCGENCPQRKRFQDVEDIKKNVMAELNAVPLDAFALFKNLLNDATHVFKLAILLSTEINQFLISLYFYLFFHTSLGNLLPYHMRAIKWSVFVMETQCRRNRNIQY